MPVLQTTGDADAFDEIARRYSVEGQFLVERVAYTYSELQELAEQIMADRDEWLAAGIDIQSAGVEVKANRAMVGILELTDDARVQLTDRYGDRIVVVQSGPFEPLNY